MIERVLMDVDDTLINTASLYLERIQDGCERIAGRFDRDQNEVAELRERIDAQLNEDGDFDLERFPRSFVHTYRHLCDRTDRNADTDFEETLFEQGMKVYDRVPERYDEAHSVLGSLSEQYDLHLYTLGHPSVQREKIREHGFDRHANAIHIVPRKTAEQVRKLYAPYDPQQCVAIGDSKLHDIKPALKTGARAILKNGTVDWSFQHSNIQTVPTIDRLHELSVPVRSHFQGSRVSTATSA